MARLFISFLRFFAIISVISFVASCGDTTTEVSYANPNLKPPTGLTAVAGNTQVVLRWTKANNPYNATYLLYYRPANTLNWTSTNVGNSDSFYIHSNLTNGRTYSYLMSATDGMFESSQTNIISATPIDMPLPPPPTNVTAVSGTSYNTIQWSAVTDAIRYNVYFSTISGRGKLADSYPTTSTSCNLSHGTSGSGVKHYYCVTVVTEKGESDTSVEVSATYGLP